MPTIYLRRHAQASFGRSDYDRLSPQGEQQAVRLGEALASRGPKPELVVAGAMRRHAQTADLARTGDPAHALQEMFGAATERWTRSDGAGYPEPFAAFCAGSEAAVRRTADRLAKEESAVVFTSGGPIAAAAGRLLSGSDDPWLRLNPLMRRRSVRAGPPWVPRARILKFVPLPLLKRMI